MSTEDHALWRAADQRLDQLLDLPAGEREAALQAMALAPALETCVRKLLRAHERDDGPLDLAARDVGLQGRQLGRWRLDEEIGRGGMAVVYRAHSEEAGETRVAAIKLLTLGALVSGGGERFRREQAMLARLQHPHIASLLDCGVADDGTPWLAMSLVDGLPIDEWCDSRGLDIPDRVRLMLDVCDAVAYAHRNLVIHRDIKPSNVLVDNDGNVRLLDFGIGGLLESRQAGMTLTRMLAWTPQYAAPEQFRLAPASTAMDVYGLGALLYRLVTGRPPRLAQPMPGPDAEPVTLPSRACLDQDTQPPPLRRIRSRTLRGDLDAVLLKALEPDPEDRYRSPDALLRDLRAWLKQRPVRARGSGTVYRLRCFIRRHRAAAVVGLVLVLAMGSGLAATLWQADRARAEAARANAAKDFLVGLFESADPESVTGRVPDTRDVLARGAETVGDTLASEPALAAEMLRLIGTVQTRLGDYERARAALHQALDLARRASLPVEHEGMALLQLGFLDSSRADYASARERLSEAIVLLKDSRKPEGERSRFYAVLYLGNTLSQLGEHDAALALMDQAAALEAALPADHRRRVHLLTYKGQAEGFAGRHEQAWATLSAGAGLVPAPSISELPLYTSLANVATTLKRYDEALRHYEVIVATMRQAYPADSPALAAPINNLSLAYGNLGRLREAEPLALESLSLRRASSGADGRLAPALSNYGALLLSLGRATDAEVALREGREIAAATLGPRNSRTLLVHSYLCLSLAMQSRPAELAECEQAWFDAMRAEAPQTDWPAAAISQLRRLAVARLMAGQPERALELLAQAGGIADPEARPANEVQAEAWRLQALAMSGRSDPEAAAALADALPQVDPSARFERADIHLALAAQARVAGDPALADQHGQAMAAVFAGGELPARYALLQARYRTL